MVQTSTTYDPFTSLPLPVPARSSKVSLRQCLDAFVKTEVMEKNDAWYYSQILTTGDSERLM